MPISKLHRMQPCRTTAALIALAVGLADISVTSAFAQSAQIEEIIVSTRKRTENLQSVPMAVSVLSDDVIERMNVSSLNAVTNLNTSLSIDQGASPLGTRLGIRGLTVSRGRPNMAIMIDGIDVTTEGVTFVGAGAL
ncbi:MAG: TonB-dependent receptor plug domain-containing protein, partial [Rhodospirillaceae bacterium]|nr:TonB-dependent receptor plug domain-containing protein [Rhodospirillaceae bacterium]